MPLPIKLLIAAAELAQDERTHKAVKAVWKAGSETIASARAEKSARNPKALMPPKKAPAKKSKIAGLKSSIERRMRFRNGQSGDLVRFAFTDEHGLTSDRMVGNWRCEKGELVGYCLNRREEIAFPVSGIANWEEIPVRRED